MSRLGDPCVEGQQWRLVAHQSRFVASALNLLLRARRPAYTVESRVGRREILQKAQKVGLAAFVLLMGASLLAMRPHEATGTGKPCVAAAYLKLASVSKSAREDVDYRLLDARLRQLMTRPAMVGLAVGVVENGRITFLQGYGETLKGSGDPVTPDTVFRWASCSKGVAATMVAKLSANRARPAPLTAAKTSADCLRRGRT